MSKLIIMCGVPGSGKSTYIKNHKAETDVVVSRDEIRFGMLEDDEEYFSHEDEVLKTFIHHIEFHLRHGQTVWADATHLSEKARAKIITLGMLADEVECIWIDTPLEVAIERNDKRDGRAWVPHDVIRRMYNNMKPPKEIEGFDKITIIKEEDNN